MKKLMSLFFLLIVCSFLFASCTDEVVTPSATPKRTILATSPTVGTVTTSVEEK